MCHIGWMYALLFGGYLSACHIGVMRGHKRVINMTIWTDGDFDLCLDISLLVILE